MTLPLSGPLATSNVNVELLNPPTQLIKLSSSPVRSLFQVPSGPISMSQGYGKSLAGTVWTSSFTGANREVNGLLWDGTQFVAVSNERDIRTSPDGVTWSANRARSLGGVTLRDVAWSGSVYVTVGASTTSPFNIISSSANANSGWASYLTNVTGNLNGVAWGPGLFVAVGAGGIITTSPDGQAWTARTSGTSVNLNKVAWSGSLFVVVGRNGTILTSPNGIAWTVRTSATTVNVVCIIWTGSQFVAGTSFVSDWTQLVQTSPDGINWTLLNTNLNQSIAAIAYSGTLYVSVFGTKVATSQNLTNWTIRSTSGLFQPVVWSGTKFVVGGFNGNIVVSP